MAGTHQKRYKLHYHGLPTEPHDYNRAFSLALKIAQRYILRPYLRERIWEDGLHEDMQQAIAAVCAEAFANNIELGSKEFMRLVSRRVYRFLVENGYKQPRGVNAFVKTETAVSHCLPEVADREAMEPEDMLDFLRLHHKRVL